MYCDFFGFKENPFSIAPDPRYLYMSERHREALAHLVYGVQSEGGFVLLTGEVGTGKTTVCRCLLEQMPEEVEVAFIINPKLTAPELLATICDELRIDYPENTTSIKLLADRINRFLLNTYAAGRKTVLILDEAQNLDAAVLEQIRLLTNLETNQHKLLQIIMLGQPELLVLLDRPELRQLAQRITARYHLKPLSAQEVTAYIKHRLALAGGQPQLFASTLRQVYKLSNGIPRLINMLCDRALLGAFVQERNRVDRHTLKKAAQELFGCRASRHSLRPKGRSWWLVAGLLLGGGGIVLGIAFYYPLHWPPQQQASIHQLQLHPTLDRLEWPAHLPLEKSRPWAYQALFAQWGLDYRPLEQGLACQHAAQKGLKCLFKRGSLGSLLRLNRPAVLKMRNDQGENYYATLIHFKKEIATFRLGAETRKVSRKEVERSWDGTYTLFWRMPPQLKKIIRPGEQATGIAWLDRQLARLQKRAPLTAAGPRLAGALLDAVRKFQIATKQRPDGIVGAQTLIQLNSLTDDSVPLLTGRNPG